MGQVWINGDALHAVRADHVFNFTHGGHFLVRVNAPEAHKFLWIGPAELQHALVVGRKAVGGFAVPPRDYAKFHAKTVEVRHNVGQGPGRAGVKADGLAGRLEHGAAFDAVDDLRRIGTETEINDVHNWYSPEPSEVEGRAGRPGKPCSPVRQTERRLREVGAEPQRRHQANHEQAVSATFSRLVLATPLAALCDFWGLHDVCQPGNGNITAKI